MSVDAGPLIRAICDELGIASAINEMVSWDPIRSKLSPGDLICALVICCFFRQRPLYKVDTTFATTDCELLIGQGVQPHDLNDDALGRALDKLPAADARKVFAAICARAAIIDQVDRRFLHWDSTSRSFHGDYEREVPADGVRVAFGHSKDHRPDLKQTRIRICGYRYHHPLRTLRNTGPRGPAEIVLSPLQALLLWEFILPALHGRDQAPEAKPPRRRMSDLRRGQLATLGDARIRQLYYELAQRLRAGLGQSVFLGDLRQGACLDPSAIEEGPMAEA